MDGGHAAGSDHVEDDVSADDAPVLLGGGAQDCRDFAGRSAIGTDNPPVLAFASARRSRTMCRETLAVMRGRRDP